MTFTLPITKAREELTKIVENANSQLAEYIITVNGAPAAVIISAAEYESWKETNEIMSNPDVVASIKAGEQDISSGKYVTFEQLKNNVLKNV